MEKHLGRKLNTNEHVHHIDGNGLNNSLDNLVVMKSHIHSSYTAKKAALKYKKKVPNYHVIKTTWKEATQLLT
jgi:hypothetical protein